MSKPLVSCLWGCGESVNPLKLNIQEVQEALSSRPKGDPGLLPIFQDLLLLSDHTVVFNCLFFVVFVVFLAGNLADQIMNFRQACTCMYDS